MKTVIETERCILREHAVEDAEVLYNLNSDPDVIKYTGDGPFADVEETKSFIASYDHFRVHGFGRWLVQLKTTDEVVGWCGLKKRKNGEIDLGYRLFKHYWNKGYATECARASLDYGLTELKMKVIIAESDIRNAGSIEVMKNCGMIYRGNSFDHGSETVIYEKRRQE